MNDDILERIITRRQRLWKSKRSVESLNLPTLNWMRLRNTSLYEIEDLVPALLARLGQVRAALDGHGGGIAIHPLSKKRMVYIWF